MNIFGVMTVNDLIDGLGGAAAVMEIAGVGRSAISNWRRFGSIPPRLYTRFAAAGREKGIVIPEILFREVPDKERVSA